MLCDCCSCDPAIPPDPDPYCRAHGIPVVKRQCDLHNSPSTCWVLNPLNLVSVQERLAGGAP
jgi:hypothetical protein